MSQMSSFMKAFMDPKKNPLARMHKNAIDKKIRAIGLRYEDLYDPEYDLDVREALNRLPRDVSFARDQRLKRSIDLSMKHMSQDLQAVQTPWRTYLKDILSVVVKEKEERKALGAELLYQRTLP